MIKLYQWLPCAVLIVGVVAVDSSCGASEQLAGDWVGGFEDGRDYAFLQIHFKSTDGKTTGTYDRPLLFQHGRSLKHVVTTSSTVSFEIANQPETQVFAGELKGGVLDGQMKQGQLRGRAVSPASQPSNRRITSACTR